LKRKIITDQNHYLLRANLFFSFEAKTVLAARCFIDQNIFIEMTQRDLLHFSIEPTIFLICRLSLYLASHASTILIQPSIYLTTWFSTWLPSNTEPPVSLLTAHLSYQADPISSIESLKILWVCTIAHLTIGASCETGVDHSHSPRGCRAAPRPIPASELTETDTKIHQLYTKQYLGRNKKRTSSFTRSLPPLAYPVKASTLYTKRRKTKKEEGRLSLSFCSYISKKRVAFFKILVLYVIVWN